MMRIPHSAIKRLESRCERTFKDANDLLFPANVIPDHPVGKDTS